MKLGIEKQLEAKVFIRTLFSLLSLPELDFSLPKELIVSLIELQQWPMIDMSQRKSRSKLSLENWENGALKMRLIWTVAGKPGQSVSTRGSLNGKPLHKGELTYNECRCR